MADPIVCRKPSGPLLIRGSPEVGLGEVGPSGNSDLPRPSVTIITDWNRVALNPVRGTTKTKCMNLLNYLQREFQYDSWANREQFRTLSTLASPPETAINLMQHIIASQFAWLDRLHNRPASTGLWPETSLADCERQLDELQAAWHSYFAQLSDDDLLRPCSYTNSRGERFTNRILDALTQLILHAAHHRGQISWEIRRSGSAPAAVDYIQAVRQGILK